MTYIHGRKEHRAPDTEHAMAYVDTRVENTCDNATSDLEVKRLLDQVHEQLYRVHIWLTLAIIT